MSELRNIIPHILRYQNYDANVTITFGKLNMLLYFCQAYYSVMHSNYSMFENTIFARCWGPEIQGIVEACPYLETYSQDGWIKSIINLKQIEDLDDKDVEHALTGDVILIISKMLDAYGHLDTRKLMLLARNDGVWENAYNDNTDLKIHPCALYEHYKKNIFFRTEE